MLPPGLGKEGHIQQALAAQNPFEMNQPADADMEYAAEALAIMGPWVAAWRDAEARRLREA